MKLYHSFIIIENSIIMIIMKL